MKCSKCDDTGVIETGNNDFPCECPAGDKAQFNVAGFDTPLTGAELRLQHNLHSAYPIGRQLDDAKREGWREGLHALAERYEGFATSDEQLLASGKISSGHRGETRTLVDVYRSVALTARNMAAPGLPPKSAAQLEVANALLASEILRLRQALKNEADLVEAALQQYTRVEQWQEWAAKTLVIMRKRVEGGE